MQTKQDLADSHAGYSVTERPPELLTVAVWIDDPTVASEVQSCLGHLPVRLIPRLAHEWDCERRIRHIEADRTDVVLLGMKSGSTKATIQRIRDAAGSPAVIAVDTATDPEAVLSTIRAGAFEYVYPPVTPHLRAALERLADLRAGQPRTTQVGKTLAFISAKGGCGATTVACHLAASLCHHTRQPVLLADFDLDNGIIGFLTKMTSSYTVEDAIQNIDRLDRNYWNALISKHGEGVDVLCSRGELSNTEQRTAQASVLGFARRQYPWLVVDFGRGPNGLTGGILESLDEIFVVTTLDVPALFRCQQTIRILTGMGCRQDQVRLVLNRISKTETLTKLEIERMLGLPVAFELPDEPAAIEDICLQGGRLPVKSALGKRVDCMAQHIAAIPEEQPKRRFLSWLT